MTALMLRVCAAWSSSVGFSKRLTRYISPRAPACFILSIVLFAAAVPVRAVARSSDCEARIEKLDASKAEGEERLFEKNSVIDTCLNQYKHDKTIVSLVRECEKYEEQPVIKQQFVAECQLAAFKYGNELRALRAQYRK